MLERILLFLSCCASLAAADRLMWEKGKAEEKRCVGCHGLKIIGTQRLSRGAWERELDKMVRWGAVINEREALIAYLVDTYGDDKPMPKPVISADGSGGAK